MSSPNHQDEDRDPALMYAPPHVREQAHATPRLPPADWPTHPHLRRPTFSGDRAMLEVQRHLALDPEWVPEPPPIFVNGSELWRITLRTGGVIGIAALIACVVAAKPGESLLELETVRVSFLDTLTSLNPSRQISSLVVTAKRPEQPKLQLAAAIGTAEEPKDQLRPRGPVAPAADTIAPARQLQAAIAQPILAPVATRQPAPTPTPAPPPAPVAASPPPPAAAPLPAAAPAAQLAAPDLVTRQLDRDELTSLLKRGEELIASGDLSSARLVLRRAAEAGNAEAAMAIAGTFDPNLLKKLGLLTVGADAATARLWYERAAQFGSAEAPRRLQQLATQISAVH
jgi:hypothetical protein